MYLLDTNCLSELRKVRAGRADRNVARWAHSVDIADLFLSVVTIFEVTTEILRLERRDPEQAGLLRQWLEQSVLPNFASRIVPVDIEVARTAASFCAPDPCDIGDALIAASAHVRGLILVTRNVADFARTSLPLLNPWLDPAEAGPNSL